MSIEPKDLPSFKKYEKYYKDFEFLLKINKSLSKIGLGNEKITTLESQLNEFKKQIENLQNYPTKYNRYFTR